MSIMPGIEARLPERTETSSGLAGSPNFLPGAAFQRAQRVVDLGFEVGGVFLA